MYKSIVIDMIVESFPWEAETHSLSFQGEKEVFTASTLRPGDGLGAA